MTALAVHGALSVLPLRCEDAVRALHGSCHAGPVQLEFLGVPVTGRRSVNGQGEESGAVKWAEGGSVKETVKYNTFSRPAEWLLP